MFSRVTRFLCCAFAMLMLLTFGGVYATWNYAELPCQEVATEFQSELMEFYWPPEQILPSDVMGKNHMDLLESILNNIKGGLNSSKDTLEKALIKEKTLHGSQNVQGGNLKHLFITNECKLLNFVITYVSSAEFHLYIYEESVLNSAVLNEDYVSVYKTILLYDGKTWSAEEAALGHAMARYSQDLYTRWIDPDEWQLGTTIHKQ